MTEKLKYFTADAAVAVAVTVRHSTDHQSHLLIIKTQISRPFKSNQPNFIKNAISRIEFMGENQERADKFNIKIARKWDIFSSNANTRKIDGVEDGSANWNAASRTRHFWHFSHSTGDGFGKYFDLLRNDRPIFESPLTDSDLSR